MIYVVIFNEDSPCRQLVEISLEVDTMKFIAYGVADLASDLAANNCFKAVIE